MPRHPLLLIMPLMRIISMSGISEYTERVSEMSVKCRVCHRELHDAAAIAAGIGPTCAANQAKRQAANELARAAAYPAAKIARIDRNVARLATMMARREQWTDEAYSLILHWYGRWRMIQIAVQRGQVTTARAAR